MPADEGHRPKWQLALELPDELATWELVSAVTLADPAYGEVGEFRLGLKQRQLTYVMQVPGTLSAYVEDVMPETVPYADRGRPPVPSLPPAALVAGACWPTGIGTPVLSEPGGGGRWPTTARRCAAPRPNAPDGDGRPVHLLAAMDHTSRAVLAQRQVGGAPEEVPALAPLLAPLDLADVVVTTDALQTHPEAAEFLVTSKQAHYLFVVKANQPTLLDRCQRLPWYRVPELDRTRDRGHGRIEVRSLKAVSVHHFGSPRGPCLAGHPARPATSTTIPGGSRP